MTSAATKRGFLKRPLSDAEYQEVLEKGSITRLETLRTKRSNLDLKEAGEKWKGVFKQWQDEWRKSHKKYKPNW